jgi:hypothetical protein
MISTIPENVLLDPIIVLELVTLFFTFCFVARSTLADSPAADNSAGVGNSTGTDWIGSRHFNNRLNGFEEKILSLFEVGNLISQPKQSLQQQRAERRTC